MILLGAFGWAGDKGGLWILVPFAAVLTSLLTAWYIGRQWTLVFMGQFRTPAFEHIREASLMMKVPMIILGALTVFIWFSLNRSEEHTSELQSLMRISYAVFCLKKKTKKQ